MRSGCIFSDMKSHARGDGLLGARVGGGGGGMRVTSEKKSTVGSFPVQRRLPGGAGIRQHRVRLSSQVPSRPPLLHPVNHSTSICQQVLGAVGAAKGGLSRPAPPPRLSSAMACPAPCLPCSHAPWEAPPISPYRHRGPGRSHVCPLAGSSGVI